jgi:hypothetical protein
MLVEEDGNNGMLLLVILEDLVSVLGEWELTQFILSFIGEENRIKMECKKLWMR